MKLVDQRKNSASNNNLKALTQVNKFPSQVYCGPRVIGVEKDNFFSSNFLCCNSEVPQPLDRTLKDKIVYSAKKPILASF